MTKRPEVIEWATDQDLTEQDVRSSIPIEMQQQGFLSAPEGFPSGPSRDVVNKLHENRGKWSVYSSHATVMHGSSAEFCADGEVGDVGVLNWRPVGRLGKGGAWGRLWEKRSFGRIHQMYCLGNYVLATTSGTRDGQPFYETVCINAHTGGQEWKDDTNEHLASDGRYIYRAGASKIYRANIADNSPAGELSIGESTVGFRLMTDGEKIYALAPGGILKAWKANFSNTLPLWTLDLGLSSFSPHADLRDFAVNGEQIALAFNTKVSTNVTITDKVGGSGSVDMVIVGTNTGLVMDAMAADVRGVAYNQDHLFIATGSSTSISLSIGPPAGAEARAVSQRRFIHFNSNHGPAHALEKVALGDGYIAVTTVLVDDNGDDIQRLSIAPLPRHGVDGTIIDLVPVYDRKVPLDPGAGEARVLMGFDPLRFFYTERSSLTGDEDIICLAMPPGVKHLVLEDTSYPYRAPFYGALGV